MSFTIVRDARLKKPVGIFNLNALCSLDFDTHVRGNFFVRSDRSPAEILTLPPGASCAELAGRG